MGAANRGLAVLGAAALTSAQKKRVFVGGGCCTTPEHIAAIGNATAPLKPRGVHAWGGYSRRREGACQAAEVLNPN